MMLDLLIGLTFTAVIGTVAYCAWVMWESRDWEDE
jgi:hypothetical protein